MMNQFGMGVTDVSSVSANEHSEVAKLGPSRCPVCSSTELSQLAPVLVPERAARGLLEEEVETIGQHLWECTTCRFNWKFPELDKAVLDRYYREADGTSWSSQRTERSGLFRSVRSLLDDTRKEGRLRIVDVGCSTGDVLTEVCSGLDGELYGIEPSTEAAQVAAGKGIEVVYPDVDGWNRNELGSSFDVILAIDVIEHLTDPSELFEVSARALSAHGRLIIVTGRADFWMTRVLGPDYRYLSLPEHVSFMSHQSIAVAAARNGLEVTNFLRVRHKTPSITRRSLYGAQNAFRYLRRRLHPTHCFKSPAPPTAGMKDHMIVELRRSPVDLRTRNGQ